MANCYNCGKIVFNEKSKEFCIDCFPRKEEILKKRMEPISSRWQDWKFEKCKIWDNAREDKWQQ